MASTRLHIEEAIRAIDPRFGRTRIQLLRLVWLQTLGRPGGAVRWVAMSHRFMASELAISQRHARRNMTVLVDAQMLLRRDPPAGRRAAVWGLQLDVEAWQCPWNSARCSTGNGFARDLGRREDTTSPLRGGARAVERTPCPPYGNETSRNTSSVVRSERRNSAPNLGITTAKSPTTAPATAGATITRSRTTDLDRQTGRRPRDPDLEALVRAVRVRLGVDGSWRIYGWPAERLRDLLGFHGLPRLLDAAKGLAPGWMPAAELPDALDDVLEHRARAGQPPAPRSAALLRSLIAAHLEGGEPPEHSPAGRTLAALREELRAVTGEA